MRRDCPSADHMILLKAPGTTCLFEVIFPVLVPVASSVSFLMIGYESTGSKVDLLRFQSAKLPPNDKKNITINKFIDVNVPEVMVAKIAEFEGDHWTSHT